MVREVGIRSKGMRRTLPMIKGESCVTRELALKAHKYLKPTKDPDSGENVTNYVPSGTEAGTWYFNNLSDVSKEKSKAISQDRISKREDAVNNGVWSMEEGKEATAVEDYVNFCNELHCVRKAVCPFGHGESFYVCDCREHQIRGVCPHSVALAFPEHVEKMKGQVILRGDGPYEKPPTRKRQFKAGSGKGNHKRRKG